MPTQLDNTWLPGAEKDINSDILGGYSKTHRVTIEVAKILEHLGNMKYIERGFIPFLRILIDSHSNLTSDDLLWYIRRGLLQEEIPLLNEIKIKGDNIVIPRALSARIKIAIDNMKKIKIAIETIQ